ncbi:MAG: hypothetical protein QOF48_1731 [Verrucomicrobiota bacterium]|jgi:hypothetical protein
MKTRSLAGFLLLCAFACAGADFDLGAHGVLSSTVPAGWTASRVAARSGPSRSAFAIAFKPTNEANAECLLSLIYIPARAPQMTTLRKDVLKASEHMIAESVEKQQVLKEFTLAKGCGAYCVFTDASLVGKAVQRGEYKVVANGQVQPSEDVLGVVSLLADDVTSTEFKAMLAIVNSLKIKPRAGGTVGPEQSVRVREAADGFEVSVAISRLVLTIPREGLTRATNNMGGATSSPRYFYFTGGTNGFVVSGWFEAETGSFGIQDFWEKESHALSRPGLPSPANVTFDKINKWDAVLYETPIPGGSNPHIRAHWREAGTWIDIHLSLATEKPSAESRKVLMKRFKEIKVTVRK